jgi:hypothetical protein
MFKSFGAVSMGAGAGVGLTFTVINPNPAITLTGLGFTDALPAGLMVSNPNGLTGSCGGTITAVAASNSITLTGGTLGPATSCTFTVNVTATGTPAGLLTNSTGPVASNQTPDGAAATATIFVGNPSQISYFGRLHLGDSVINITNAGILAAGTQSGLSAAITGSICVNAFAFTADEQIMACCSCPVTPNGLVSFSVRQDFLPNTLTLAIPTSLIVKLIATVPVGGTCTNSAIGVATAPLASGMVAWGTKLHVTGDLSAGGKIYGTEAPFINTIASAGELYRLGALCLLIEELGSGFGICRSCRLGGLGAAAR